MYRSIQLELLYQVSSNYAMGKTMVLSMSGSANRFTTHFEVVLQDSISQYQLNAYFNIPNMISGQEAGFVNSILIHEGSCIENGKFLKFRLRRFASLYFIRVQANSRTFR